jgi:hypothetical protein
MAVLSGLNHFSYSKLRKQNNMLKLRHFLSRQRAGGWPNSRLNARLKATSES